VTVSTIEVTDGFEIGPGTAAEQATMCQPGTSVPAGGSCNIYVNFAPSATGTTTGTLTVTDSAPDSPQTTTLTGTTGCNANPTGATYKQYVNPPSNRWLPQEDYSTDDGNPVPQYFGFLPTPFGVPVVPYVNPFVLCAAVKGGCALTSTATMLSSFGMSFDSVGLDSMLRIPAPLVTKTVVPGPVGYSKGTSDLCPSETPTCTEDQRIPYPDWCEFSWERLPLALGNSVKYQGSQEVVVVTGSEEPTTWDEDKNKEGEEGDVPLSQYLADFVCADTDQFATPPANRSFSPPAGVVLELYHRGTTRQHFIVVQGRTENDDDWSVFDPGSGDPNSDTLQAHITTGVKVNGQMNYYDIAGTRTYQPVSSSSSSAQAGALAVQAAAVSTWTAPQRRFAAGSTSSAGFFAGTANSPLELLITDRTGRQLGNINGRDVFDVPYGSYTRDFPFDDDDSGGTANGDTTGIKGFSVPSPPDGTYQIVATGTGAGPYTLTLIAVASDGTEQEVTLTGTASLGSVVTYQATYSSTPGAPFTVEAVQPVASLSANALNFPNEPVGVASSPQNVTLSNTGTGTLVVTGIGVSGANGADFTESDTCGTEPAQLAPGGSCTISVTFTP
jgi:hypothetical protein